MHRTLRRALTAIGWLLLSAVVVAAGVALWIIVPGSPSQAKSMEFKGFVELPKGAFLSILDYLTIEDKQLYVTDEGSGNVYKIALRKSSLPSEADIATLAGEPATHGVLIDPLTHLGFVTRSEVNTVDIFNPTTMAITKRIQVGDDPDAIFFEPLQKLVYVANGGAHRATLIDPQSATVVATIGFGGKPEYAAFDSKTNLLYQNLRDRNEVAVVDVAKKAIVEHWKLEQCEEPTGMSIDALHRRLFIVCGHNHMLVVFDIEKQEVIYSLSIGGGPDSVVFDPMLHRLYTTGKSGVLVIVQQDTPDAYHVLDRISLHYGAHTLAVDSDTHFLYVGYASLLVRPRIAVFQPLT